jgi:tRNA-dihydrouridine synthase A
VLAQAAAIAEGYGYAEINLNIGCPSDRVQSGQFGACLMAEPERVAACVGAMQSQTDLPVTIKTRIGIDDHDDYEFLANFVAVVSAAGCNIFIVHGRKAILAGLSPKENRSIPPLRYDTVYRLKQEFPQLRIILNGGIETVAAVQKHLEHVDGVMIGRKAYSDPVFLAELQKRFLDPVTGVETGRPSRGQVVRQMAEYAQRQQRKGVRLHHITRHMLGLYNGEPGARGWRRFLSENARGINAGPEVLVDSLEQF